MADTSLLPSFARYEQSFGDFDQALKKQRNVWLLPSAARYCATLASLCMKAHVLVLVISSHSIAPMHQELKKHEKTVPSP